MFDDERKDEMETGGALARLWLAVREAIDDRILRASLPEDPDRVTLSDEKITITVEGRYKREYCSKKLEKLSEAVARVIGPREIAIEEGRSEGRGRETRSDRPPARPVSYTHLTLPTN